MQVQQFDIVSVEGKDGEWLVDSATVKTCREGARAGSRYVWVTVRNPATGETFFFPQKNALDGAHFPQNGRDATLIRRQGDPDAKYGETAGNVRYVVTRQEYIGQGNHTDVCGLNQTREGAVRRMTDLLMAERAASSRQEDRDQPFDPESEETWVVGDDVTYYVSPMFVGD